MAAIDITHLSKSFVSAAGETLSVIESLNLRVAHEAFVSIIGPSGSGKSTLLNIIAGLEYPDSGRVLINGEDVAGRRGLVAYMPQRDALLPWRTVLENAVLAAEVQGHDVKAARQEAHELLPTFGLEGFGDCVPSMLSGGMRQRAALMRTLLWKQPIMLLDEPFGALDALTRMQLQQWLLRLWHQMERTVLLVTHDIDEALLLSDEIYVFSSRPGRVICHEHVPFPRPRTYEMITSAPFQERKAVLMGALQLDQGKAH